MSAERGWIGEPQPKTEWRESFYSRQAKRRIEERQKEYQELCSPHTGLLNKQGTRCLNCGW